VVLKVRGALGETLLPETLYGPILDALYSYRPMTVSDIENSVRGRGIILAQIVKAVTLLVGMGVLLNAQNDAQISATRPLAKRLNAVICEQARHHDEVQFLVSPVSGSGILMPRVAQLFLLARLHHMQQPTQWAEFAESVLRATPQPARATSGPPSGAAVSLADLIAKANRFAQIHLPILQALGIA
jgi:hypothetical protein